jgi:tetratricopeptide (TPR) repeat protein
MMGALLMGFGTAAMAQDGTAADVEAVKNLVKAKPADYAKQIKAYFKENKKNNENLVAIGRVLMEGEDYVNAKMFGDQTLSNTKYNYAPGYVLLGDIAAMQEDGGAAATNYEQAIMSDPKAPEAYRKYATVYRKIDPEGAVQKLEELRQQRPDYPVDAMIGHINYLSLRYGKANDAYSKVPVDQLKRMDFIEYAMSNYHGRQYDKALEIVKAGLAKEPLNATMTRIAMMCSNEVKNFPEALQYAEDLFTKVNKDSVTINDIDYQNYGKAYFGNGQYQEAIAKYQEALKMPAEDNSLHADLYSSISDCYEEMKDFPNAIDSYKHYLAARTDADATAYAGLGILWNKYARTLQGEEKAATLKQADEAYADLITKFPDAEEYGLLQRGRVNAQLDTDLQGLAKPYFERLAELINAHETIDDTDKSRLFDVHSYLMRYYVKNKDNKSALDNARKLQELQPEDADIKKVVEALEKAAN